MDQAKEAMIRHDDGLSAAAQAPKVCPWTDPEFKMSPDLPCPVCGALGDMTAFEKCIG